MSKLSIIIPSYCEPYLNNTLDSILKNATGEIEVLVNLDGKPMEKPLKDKRISYTRCAKPIGMRGGINKGIGRATGKYIMKVDAHCAFGEGFDEVLKKDSEKDWLVIPRRYPLHAVNWDRTILRSVKDYHYFSYPAMGFYGLGIFCPEWRERTRERFNNSKYEIDDTMAFQGSCWVANRDYFMENIGFLDDSDGHYSSFSSEQLEVGLKYWLKAGGKVKVNKKTWYAHLFKNEKYYQNRHELRRNKRNICQNSGFEWAAKHWINNKEPGLKHNMSWLVEKFWPVPSWPEDRNLWKI